MLEFRDVAGVKVQRPSIDRDELVPERAHFRGEFAFEHVHIDGGDQTGVNGEGTLSHTLVTTVNLAEARLGSLSLSDVAFEDTDLSNAVLPETTVRRVELVRCRGIGVQLSLVQATDLYVQDSQFDYATIRIAKVKNPAVFSGCSFRETLFVGDLSNVVFTECEFTGAEFEATRATDCDLRGSRLAGVRGLLSLRGAKITHEQALSVATTIATESGFTVTD
jgi:uncharacterized protein YjbI with pentapeptide repeats